MKGKNKSIKKLFLPLFLLLFITLIYGKTICDNPLSEEEIKRQCDGMIASFKIDTNPENVAERVVKAVLSKVNIGDKGTFGKDRGYRVSRIQITLFCESEKKLFLDKFIDLGDKQNRKIILVKSCQKDDRDKPGDYYGTVSVQIFLEEIEENKVDMKADKTSIKPEEVSTISIKLNMADCPVKGKTITLKKQGPGTLPNSVKTDDNGEARVQFKAEKEGETSILAIYNGTSAEINIETSEELYWDVAVTVQYYREFTSSRGDFHSVKDWTSEVLFKDVFIPLQSYSLKNFTSQNLKELGTLVKYMEKRGLSNKLLSSKGKFTKEYFMQRKRGRHFRGKRTGEPEWGFGASYSLREIPISRSDSVIFFLSLPATGVGGPVVRYEGDSFPYSIVFMQRCDIPLEKLRKKKPFTFDIEDSKRSKSGNGSYTKWKIKFCLTPKR
jgi:hypothetical protein